MGDQATPAALIEWGVDDVTHWLGTIGMEKYAESFVENEIDGAILADLTHELLSEMGVKVIGHRMKILREIKALEEKKKVAVGVPAQQEAPRIRTAETEAKKEPADDLEKLQPKPSQAPTPETKTDKGGEFTEEVDPKLAKDGDYSTYSALTALSASEVRFIDADYKGWMTKEGAKIKSWKKRYFVLKDMILQYYTSPNSTTPKGKIIVPSYQCIKRKPEKEKDNEFHFRLTHPGMRAYNMFTDTAEERENWIYAIEKRGLATATTQKIPDEMENEGVGETQVEVARNEVGEMHGNVRGKQEKAPPGLTLDHVRKTPPIIPPKPKSAIPAPKPAESKQRGTNKADIPPLPVASTVSPAKTQPKAEEESEETADVDYLSMEAILEAQVGGSENGELGNSFVKRMQGVLPIQPAKKPLRPPPNPTDNEKPVPVEDKPKTLPILEDTGDDFFAPKREPPKPPTAKPRKTFDTHEGETQIKPSLIAARKESRARKPLPPQEMVIEWMNGHLAQRNMKVVSPAKDLVDGVLFINLLELLAKRSFGEYHLFPETDSEKYENLKHVQKILLHLEVRCGFLINDIMKGKLMAILRVCLGINAYFSRPNKIAMKPNNL